MAGRVVRRVGARFGLAGAGALAGAAVLGVVGLAGAGSAGAGAPAVGGSTVTLHYFSKSTATNYFGPDGKAVDPNAAPQSGDYIDSFALDYVGTHSSHAKAATGSDHLVCVIGSISGSGGSATCDGFIALGGSMLFADHQTIALTTQNAPMTIKITGGTGQYQGVRGTIRTASVGSSNNSDFTLKVSRSGRVQAVPSGGAPGLSSASITRFYAVGLNGANQGFYGPDGKALSPNAAPAVGDYLASSGNDFTGTHSSHAKKASGSDHLVCTIVTATSSGGTALCDAAIARGNQMLVGDHETIDLTATSPPFSITGGSGSYDGAHGSLQSTSVGNSGNADFSLSVSQ